MFDVNIWNCFLSTLGFGQDIVGPCSNRVAVGVAQFATFKTRSMHVDVQDHLLSRNVTEWVRAFLKAELIMLVTGKYIRTTC